MHKNVQKKRSRKSIIITAIVVVVALATAGVASYFYWAQYIKETQSGDTASPQTEAYGDGGGTLAEVDALTGTNDNDAANEKLDKAIDASTSDDEKGNFYLRKATLVSSADPAAALEHMKKAIEFVPSYGNYGFAADLADRLGDTTASIEYYEQASKAYKANPPAGGDSLGSGYYDAKIERLRAR